MTESESDSENDFSPESKFEQDFLVELNKSADKTLLRFNHNFWLKCENSTDKLCKVLKTLPEEVIAKFFKFFCLTRDEQGDPSLHFLINNGCSRCLKCFFEHHSFKGFIKQSIASDGTNVFHVASYPSAVQCLVILLGNMTGENPYWTLLFEKTSEGLTPLAKLRNTRRKCLLLMEETMRQHMRDLLPTFNRILLQEIDHIDLESPLIGARSEKLLRSLSINLSTAFPLRLPHVRIGSFNIKNFGLQTKIKRNNKALFEMISDFDLTVVQELVAAPSPNYHSDGTQQKTSDAAASFMDLVHKAGKGIQHSPDKAGTNLKTKSFTSEYALSVYDPTIMISHTGCGYIDYTSEKGKGSYPGVRVPFVFVFKPRFPLERQMPNCEIIFRIITVHLTPGKGKLNASKRQNEISAIFRFLSESKEYIIMGDWNLENAEEWNSMADYLNSHGYNLLKGKNGAIVNTNIKQKNPYDCIALCISHWNSLGLSVGPLECNPLPIDADPRVLSDHSPVSVLFGACNI